MAKYEVLTDQGFKPFYGVKKTTGAGWRLTFDDGTDLVCSTNHMINIDGRFKPAFQIEPGDVASTGVTVTSKTRISDELELYDLLNVADGAHYTTGSVESHNCAFVERWEELYAAIKPVISSGKKSKMILTSTPNGMNHYYDLWQAATGDVGSKFVPYTATWQSVKFRLYNDAGDFDDGLEFETSEIADGSREQFAQEHNCLAGHTHVRVDLGDGKQDMTLEELYQYEQEQADPDA